MIYLKLIIYTAKNSSVVSQKKRYVISRGGCWHRAYEYALNVVELLSSKLMRAIEFDLTSEIPIKL